MNVEPQDVDERILQERLLQERLAVNFSLKLPLSIYDVDKDKILETLGKCSHKKSRSGAKGLDKLVGMKDEEKLGSVRKDLFRQGDEEGDEEDDEHIALSKSPKSPAREGTTLGQQSTTLSPKMSRLMGLKTLLKVMTGYFGPFTFLDNQVTFDTVFRSAPNILCSLPLKDASVLKEDIDDFIENCKFDIFMASCRS